MTNNTPRDERDNLMILYKRTNGASLKSLAEEYGVSASRIQQICAREARRERSRATRMGQSHLGRLKLR